MNVAVGKVGKSILFDSSKWSAIGGDVEAPTFYLHLFDAFPDDVFYIIGKSDYSKWADKNGWHDNVVDCWSDFNASKDYAPTWVNDFLKDVHIDFGLIYGGPTGRANIEGYTPKANSPGLSKVLEMFNKYAGPMFYYFNESNIPWFLITVDPRYWPFKSVDLINCPKFSFSQYQSKAKFRHMKSLDDRTTIVDHYVESDYSAIESVFLLNEQKPDRDEYLNRKRSTKLTIVLNEGGNGGLLRGPMLKEYILDHVDDVAIYGKWSKEWSSDERFKGPVRFNDLKSLLHDTKYTFIIPIQKGWVTAKYLEMIAYGVIPFYHPWYDTQRWTGIPDFLRVSNPYTLHKRIEMLENDEHLYREILNKCYDLLNDEFYDGRWANRIFNYSKKLLGDL